MIASRPRTGRINGHAWRLVVGVAALGVCAVASGCAAYSAERAQFESHRVTVFPAAPGATFTGGQMTASANRN